MKKLRSALKLTSDNPEITELILQASASAHTDSEGFNLPESVPNPVRYWYSFILSYLVRGLWEHCFFLHLKGNGGYLAHPAGGLEPHKTNCGQNSFGQFMPWHTLI